MSPNINKSEYMSFSSPVSGIPGNSSAETSVTTSESISLPPKTPYSISSHSIRSSRYETKDIIKPVRSFVSSRSQRDRLWLNLDRPLQETRFAGMFLNFLSF